MKQIICPKKGFKLSQEPDCKCETFKIFKDKKNNIIAECTECKTRYQLDKM